MVRTAVLEPVCQARGIGMASTAFGLGFSSWLKERRESKGWSGERLAEEVGTSQGNISMYERGGRTPRRDMVKKIAAALGADEGTALLAGGYVPEHNQDGSPAVPTIPGMQTFPGVVTPSGEMVYIIAPEGLSPEKIAESRRALRIVLGEE